MYLALNLWLRSISDIRVPFLWVWSAPVDPLYCIPPIGDRNPGLSPCFHWLPYFNSLKIPCLFTSLVDVCSSRRLPAVLACAVQCLIFFVLRLLAVCLSVRMSKPELPRGYLGPQPKFSEFKLSTLSHNDPEITADSNEVGFPICQFIIYYSSSWLCTFYFKFLSKFIVLHLSYLKNSLNTILLMLYRI